MMPRSVLTRVALAVLIGLVTPTLIRAATTACFTPGHNYTDAIVQALSDPKRTILVQTYSFPSAPIAKALLDAHTRSPRRHILYSGAE